MQKQKLRTLRLISYPLVTLTVYKIFEVLIEIIGGKIGEGLNKFGISNWTILYILFGVLALIYFFEARAVLLHKKEDSVDANPEEDFETDNKRFFDSLKERYQNRYEQKLDGRFDIPLEVSQNWDVIKTQIISERFNKNASVGEAIKIISQIFEKKGRLLIVGNPGAGKTVLLLKLALKLLDNITDIENAKFPVVINLASWSDEYKKFEDFLIENLKNGYGLPIDFWSKLLQKRRIIFLLDGLDEVASNQTKTFAAEKQAACLTSLNNYLKRDMMAVICCRINEFVQIKKTTGQNAPVAAKVIIKDLNSNQIEKALSQAANEKVNKTAAENLLSILNSDKKRIFLDVLCTPFYFITAIEVFDKSILYDEEIPCKTDELKNYLIDRFVETKLDCTPNPYKFNSKKTIKWLKWLAENLTAQQQVIFELKDLQPYHLERQFILGTFAGIFCGIFWEIWFLGFLGSNFWGIGLLSGFLFFQVLGSFGLLRKLIITEDIKHWHLSFIFKWIFWKSYIIPILTISITGGYLFGLIIRLLGFTQISRFRVSFFLVLMILGIFIIKRSLFLVQAISFYPYIQKPYQRLLSGIKYQVLEFFAIGLIVSFFVSYTFNLGLYIIVFGCLLTGFMGFLSTPFFRHFNLRICLAFEDKMPLRYVTFLDYATSLRILEKDGGHWRFRHQFLQDYFTRHKIV